MAAPAPGLVYELDLAARGFSRVAGLDEAGRGAWAGPVVAGAVILPLENDTLQQTLSGVRDSKLLSPRAREQLYVIITGIASAWASGQASADEIDTMGIAAANRLAMQRAVECLTLPPDALLIDYFRLRALPLEQICLKKGESHSLSIAAASIIAKVTRDRLLEAAENQFPGYGFAKHKGYGTAEHRRAVAESGPCVLHRRSFAPIRPHLPERSQER